MAGNSSKAPQKRQTVKWHAGASEHKLGPVNSSVWGRAPVHTSHPPLISTSISKTSHTQPLCVVTCGGDGRRGGRRKWVRIGTLLWPRRQTGTNVIITCSCFPPQHQQMAAPPVRRRSRAAYMFKMWQRPFLWLIMKLARARTVGLPPVCQRQCAPTRERCREFSLHSHDTVTQPCWIIGGGGVIVTRLPRPKTALLYLTWPHRSPQRSGLLLTLMGGSGGHVGSDNCSHFLPGSSS